MIHFSKEYWDKQYEILHASKVPKVVKKFWDKGGKKVPRNFLQYCASVGLKDAWLYNMNKSPEFKIAIDAVKDENVSLFVRTLLALRIEKDELCALVNGNWHTSMKCLITWCSVVLITIVAGPGSLMERSHPAIGILEYGRMANCEKMCRINMDRMSSRII